MNRKSIKTKAAVLILLLGIINIGIISIFTYKTLKGKTEEHFFSNAELISEYTSVSFNKMVKYSELAIRQIADQTGETDEEKISSLLKSSMKLIPDSYLLLYADLTGKFYDNTETVYPESYDPRKREWYKKTVSAPKEKILWSSPFIEYINQNIIISLSRKVYSEKGILKGVISAFFDVRTIGRSFHYSGIGEKGFLMLINKKGQVIAESRNRFIGKYIFGDNFSVTEHVSKNDNLFPVFLGKEKYYIKLNSINSNDMFIAAALSRKELNKDIFNSLITPFTAALYILAAFITITYIIVRRWTSHLNSLADLMNNAESGDYSVKADFKKYSELESLSNSFNRMINGIKTRDEILKHREIKIRNLAYYDSLTGLPNRAYLNKKLDSIFETENRNSQKGALFYIDLDRFKIINDTKGHAVGDLVLKDAAKRISHNLRYEQTAARIGGDEFIIIIPEITDSSILSTIAERIIKMINKPVTVNNDIFSIGASIGIAVYPKDGSSRETIISNGDTAMYYAKTTGKNCFSFFSDFYCDNNID